MQEWLNWHAWKACVPQKGTGGSNPPLSATQNHSRPPAGGRDFCFMTVRMRFASMRKGIKQKSLTTKRSKGMILSCRDPSKGIAEGNPMYSPSRPPSLLRKERGEVPALKGLYPLQITYAELANQHY